MVGVAGGSVNADVTSGFRVMRNGRGLPALMKDSLDRRLLPGYAFKYHEGTLGWDKLLSGCSGHLLVMMDSPSWNYRCFSGQSAHTQMKKTIPACCGVTPVAIPNVGPVRRAAPETGAKWVAQTREIGRPV